jgi:outer membrane lipoprotein-sorting protein
MIFSLCKRLVPLSMLCCSLSGCFMVYTTRHLPVPKPPTSVQTVTAEELVARLNDRWKQMDTLSATVEISATTLEVKKGEAKDYTTFPANILIRKPGMLRVYGRAPVVRTKIFDMASDGNSFTIYIPSKSKAYKGLNVLKKKLEDPMLNLRPGFFLDALVVRGLEPDDYYTVTTESETIEDPAKKHLFQVPEYTLSIMRRKEGSRQLTPVRVITFHREDLLPYEQDIYDAEGNLETHVSYAGYQDTGNGLYPTIVTIKRPIEGKQVTLSVDKVTVNMSLSDDQFTVKVPDGTEVQTLE